MNHPLGEKRKIRNPRNLKVAATLQNPNRSI